MITKSENYGLRNTTVTARLCPAIIADETLTHCRLWSQATELLIMPTAPVELERPAFERAKRQALDIVVVKHIACQPRIR